MRNRLRRIILASVLLLCALLCGALLSVPWGNLLTLGLYTAAYLVVGWKVLWKAARNILRGRVFDENFLMSVATVGAYAIGEYTEAVAVMLFYQLGELFEHYAVDKSRRSIGDLMNIRPDRAAVLREGGSVETLDPAEVKIGEVVVVEAGERIPSDGVIVFGESTMDTSALTGESLPRGVVVGDEVQSGCINLTGLIHVKVTKEYGASTAAKILDLVENAASKKSKPERFITRFAAVYTPVVVISALLLAVVPPLFIQGEVFHDWFYRALNFLIVSCPCALVISVPLSFFGGMGGASKQGILIKGSNYLEALSRGEIAVFDKTGTLTKGRFEVTGIYGEDGEELLSLAAMAEAHSRHPLALAICEEYKKTVPSERQTAWERLPAARVTETAGNGVEAVIGERVVLCGNDNLMRSAGIEPATTEETAVHIATVPVATVPVASDGIYLGYIALADTLKPDGADTIRQLKERGIRKTVMLTGDGETAAQTVAEAVGVDEYRWKLLPGDKVAAVESLLLEKSEKGTLIYMGDGINDAPVLTRADVGVAMGGLGRDAAIEAADVVIMTDEVSKLATAITIGKKTMTIARQNIGFALGVKAAILVCSAFGYTGMWAAVFADVGVSVLATLNAMRCGR